MKKKLAIITTHPIQYNAPLFELISRRGKILIKVFYTWGESVVKEKYDPGFEKNIGWDIPLLNGYDYTFAGNSSTRPGSHHFNGIVNPGLIKDITDWKADAVLIYGWCFSSHLKAMRHFHGKIPVFFRGDSTLLDTKSKWKDVLRATLLKWVYRFVDKAIYVGLNNKEYFLEYGIKEANMVWAPHAIDIERFKPTQPNVVWANNIKKELGIPLNNFTFLYAGKFEEKKDPAILLQAFCEIDSKNISLIMVGNGPAEKELKNKYESKPGIYFIGFQNQSDMPAVYQLADIFVLPSKGPGETWGLSINEAMASGKPVIASDRCGASVDLIVANKDGFVFRHSDLEDLKSKMMYIQTKKSAIQDWGSVSRDIIRNWSFEKCAEVIESLIYIPGEKSHNINSQVS